MTDSRWGGLLAKAYPAGGYEKRIEEIEIASIVISQDARAWEISFQCAFLPTERERAQMLFVFRETFSRDATYSLNGQVREEAPQPTALLETALAAPEAAPYSEGGLEEMEAQLNRRLHEKNGESKGKEKVPVVFLGRKINGEPCPLSEVIDESRNTILDAMAFRVNEQKLMKAGTMLYDFDVTDYTGSIKVKIFSDEKSQKREKAGWLKEGAWYRMKGSARYDSFQKELVFFPDHIMEGSGRRRRDDAAEKRVELHLHTKLSAMDALVAPKDLVKQAVDWGVGAVAVTDHGVVQAFPEFMEEAAKANAGGEKKIKIIYGLEAYLIEGDGRAFMAKTKRAKKSPGGVKQEPGENSQADNDEQDSWHILLLAKNQAGIKNLYELVTISHLDYFYKKPRIPRSELTRLREGLIVGSACSEGELFRLALSGADEETLEAAASFYDFLEIQPVMNNGYLIRNGTAPDEEYLRGLNRKILALGRKAGKTVAATGDVHFLAPEDALLRRILQAGQKYRDADIQPPLYYHTTQEMLEEFAYLGEEEAYRVVVEATRGIAGQAEYLEPIPHVLSMPKLPGAKEEIEKAVRQRAKELFGEAMPEWISQRLEREMKSITENGYADLYYFAYKLVKRSNDNGYMVGSRGSVGSSFAAFLAGITEVNPLAPHYLCRNASCKKIVKGDEAVYGCGADMPAMDCPDCGSPMVKDGFNIPFEVFLGFEGGGKIPDIDLNFSGEFQTQAQKYTEELFGRENIFKAGTIFTIAEKTAYGFVRNYYDGKGLAVREVESERLVKGLTGVRRTTSQHPGGIVVLPKGDEITNYTPVQRPADDPDSEFVTTHFDYHSFEKCLVKLDILGHDTPTMIRLLTGMTGKDILEISLDDPNVISLFHGPEALGIDPKESGIETGALGIPEFGTDFVQGMLLDTKPATFSDLVRISGFSHGTDVWLGNARDILRNHIGTMKEVIGCREDIMLTLIRAGVNALHAFRIMERVRRGGGLSLEDINAMEDAQIPPWYIESCNKIQYLFPKAHAVAYVMMAFRIAWFKIFEPLAFYAAIFSVREGLDGTIAAGGMDPIEKAMAEIKAKRDRKEASGREEDHYISLELAREMLLRGFSFLPVHLEKSDAGHYIMEGGKLRLPFTSLSGLGLTAAKGIVEARGEKPFCSVEDLRRRGKAGNALTLILKEHGALGDLPESDQQSMFQG